MRRPYYFSTQDLVTIALLSSLGGVMSAYVSYIAQFINHAFGVPFGAGQIVAGLHIFWLVLILTIVRKRGSATLAGIIKGIVELFSGGSHGIVIVFVSTIQGVTLDILLFLYLLRDFKPWVALAAGVSSCTNVIVFQLIYFSSSGELVVPLEFILAITIVSFGSGVVLGGFLGLEIFDVLNESGVIPPMTIGIEKGMKAPPELPETNHFHSKWWKALHPSSIVAFGMILLLALGAVGYFALVYESPFRDRFACSITGAVEDPYTYHPRDFVDFETTIEAELVGSVTYVPPRNYTGVPIYVILTEANPMSQATQLRVVASDGYYADFDMVSVMTDSQMILIKDENQGLRLIAADYDGWFWVHSVVRLEVR